MKHETHIPTQQKAPQKNDWIPSSDEDGRGPQSHQPAPQSGPQTVGRLIFSKTMRLRKRGEFQRVAREGRRLVGRYLCLDYRPAREARLGISASSRYGSSPERNRFKRLVREAFRRSYGALPAFDLNVIPRQCAKKASYGHILEEITRLLQCR